VLGDTGASTDGENGPVGASCGTQEPADGFVARAGGGSRAAGPAGRVTAEAPNTGAFGVEPLGPQRGVWPGDAQLDITKIIGGSDEPG